jgi:hypothetical protein
MLKKMKIVMFFCNQVKTESKTRGRAAFARVFSVDECGVLSENSEYIRQSLGLAKVNVVMMGSDEAAGVKLKEAPTPGHPVALLSHEG